MEMSLSVQNRDTFTIISSYTILRYIFCILHLPWLLLLLMFRNWIGRSETTNIFMTNIFYWNYFQICCSCEMSHPFLKQDTFMSLWVILFYSNVFCNDLKDREELCVWIKYIGPLFNQISHLLEFHCIPLYHFSPFHKSFLYCLFEWNYPVVNVLENKIQYLMPISKPGNQYRYHTIIQFIDLNSNFIKWSENMSFPFIF